MATTTSDAFAAARSLLDSFYSDEVRSSSILNGFWNAGWAARYGMKSSKRVSLESNRAEWQ